jgi:hypothetical protein
MYEHTLNYLADVRRKHNFIEIYHTLTPEDAMAVNDAGVQTGRMYDTREACKKNAGGCELCLMVVWVGGEGYMNAYFWTNPHVCVTPPPPRPLSPSLSRLVCDPFTPPSSTSLFRLSRLSCTRTVGNP